ncbi:DUF839 domain-containing protein [Pendulispora brunnea]|uniref:DUF839 domain-containing protein n=1 Tax=Pendulispora brunnea TaxID=2905690 RepID=A0ABZ2K146_9BACT
MMPIFRTTVGLLTGSFLVLAFGCSGDDGANGASGGNGNNGKDGANGNDAPQAPPANAARWLSFGDVGFPRTNLEKNQVRASGKANVDGKEVPIGYQPILRSGQDPSRPDKKCDLVASPSTCAGAQLAKDGTLLKDDGGEPMISNQNDFSSLLDVGGNKFLVHSFESYPAALYVTKLTQADTGALSATATKAIDLSSIDGLYRSCAGSITPWGTHLSGEEAQVDARPVDAAATWEALGKTGRWGEIKLMGRYLGLDFTDANGDGAPDANVSAFQSAYSAYFHGYAVEVALDANGTPAVKKHYAMGRLGMELAYVMPDKKTVFLTDDVTNGTLLMFVADAAGDLGAGNLYAMRVYQTAPAGGTFQADIEWVPLGHATDAEISALIHPAGGPRIKFQDIFDAADVQTGNTCADGYTLVRANGDNENLECLKLKPGKELAASRLETRRYAVIKGATAELTKEEGLTYDPDTNRLYIGLSDITASMGTQSGGDNHINVAANRCGGVFALDVGPWVDSNGAKVTDYAALNWYPLIAGSETAYPASSAYAGNTCAVSGLASPDNVTYLPGYKVLMIGEDTGRHQNDALWAYHVPSGKLTRVLTTPYGSEVTSPYWVPKLGNHGYLITSVQHPYGESDSSHAKDTEATGTASWIGVVGPFPVLQ